jgi:glycerol uptake facilitator-like aquaporin
MTDKTLSDHIGIILFLIALFLAFQTWGVWNAYRDAGKRIKAGYRPKKRNKKK